MYGPDSRKTAGGGIAVLDPPVTAPTRMGESHPSDHVVELAACHPEELCRVLLDPARPPERFLDESTLHGLKGQSTPRKESRQLLRSASASHEGCGIGEPDVGTVDPRTVR